MLRFLRKRSLAEGPPQPADDRFSKARIHTNRIGTLQEDQNPLRSVIEGCH